METLVDATVLPDRSVPEAGIERVPDVESKFVRFTVRGSACPMPAPWTSVGESDRGTRVADAQREQE